MYLIFVECPVGYFGQNCSVICSWPNYGALCSKVCECQPCHHAYGCNLTKETTGSINEVTQSTFSLQIHWNINLVCINVHAEIHSISVYC